MLFKDVFIKYNLRNSKKITEIKHIAWKWLFGLTAVVFYRCESPPVPAVKNRLYQIQQKQMNASNFPVHNGNIGREKNTNADMQQRKSSPVTEPERPPSSHFIPYVRTNEVYYLDPDAPMTRPSTHDPQYRQFNGTEMCIL